MADLRFMAGFADDAALAVMRSSNIGNNTTMIGNPVRPAQKPGQKPGPSTGAGAQAGPSSFDQTLDQIDHVTNKMMMGSFVGAAGLGVGANISRWGAKKTGYETLKHVGDGMDKIHNAKFSSMGGIPILSDIGRGIGSLTQSVTTMGANLLEATGIAGWRSDVNARKFTKHQAALTDHAEKLFASDFKHPEVHSKMMMLKEAIDVAPKDFNEAAFGTALKDAQDAAAQHTPGLKTHLNKLETLAGKAHDKYLLAEGWGNLSTHAGKTADKLKNVGVAHGVMNSAILVGTAISDYRTGRDLHKAIKDLRQMYADQTHQDPNKVSGTKLLFGTLPPSVSAARGQMFREFGPSMVMDAANTVLNLHWVVRNKGSMMLLIAAGMGSQLIRGVLAGNILPTYSALKSQQDAGGKLSADDYAKLVGETWRELKVRGGAESNFAKGLGEALAEEQMKVSEVVAQIDNGKMHDRLEHMKAEAMKMAHVFEAQKAQAKGEQPAKTESHDASAAHAAHSHVERLNQKEAQPEMHHRKDKHDHKIVGKHTEKLHKAAHDAAASVGMGGVV